MTLSDLLWMVLFASVIAYWLNAMRAKELARHEAKRLCQQSNVLILDDTVSLKKIGFKRNSLGQMSFLRAYDFEFTLDGEFRYKGEVSLLGQQVLDSHLDAYRVS